MSFIYIESVLRSPNTFVVATFGRTLLSGIADRDSDMLLYIIIS